MIFSRILFSGFLLVLLTIGGCLRQSLPISNKGIRWDGDDLGLVAVVTGEIEKRVLFDRKKVSDEMLVDAFGDESAWVAAHVLLTFREHREQRRSPTEWNGLKVALHADGSVQIDPAQRSNLARSWSDDFANKRKENQR